MFDKCPILNNISYLRKYFISYCILMNCTQIQMLATINRLDATMDTGTITTTNELDGASNYSHANTDNNTDY